MPFWQDHTEVLLMVGLAADRSAAPEAKHHAYWALDTSVLYFSDNDLNWVQAGSVSPLPLMDGGLGADVSGYEGLIKIHSGAASNIQCDFAKTTAPGASDDNTAGWGVFSLWYNSTTHTLYICTNPATGAAVWNEIGLTWAPADAHYWTSQAESGLSNERNVGALDPGIIVHVAGVPASIAPFICEGRLTLESGEPVSATDQDNKTTLYWTPFDGGLIRLWSGSGFEYFKPGELSLAVTGLSVNTLYDVFMDYNGGSPQLAWGAAWSSDTARSVALAKYTGEDIQYYSSDDTLLYLGTVYVASNGGSPVLKDVGGGIDTPAERLVCNRYNQLRRHIRVGPSADSWTYSTAAFRQLNGDSNMRADFVVGLDRNEVEFIFNLQSLGNTAGIGLDSTSANDTETLVRGVSVSASTRLLSTARYAGHTGIGKHSLNLIEYGSNAAYGDNGNPDRLQSGADGHVYC